MRSVTVDGSSVSFEILFKKPSIAATKQFVRPATLLSKHYDAWSDPQSAAVMGYFRNQKEHTLVKKIVFSTASGPPSGGQLLC